MALAAGRLRHLVAVEEQVTVINSYGESETAWVPFASVWAAIEPLSAREFLAASQVQSAVTCKIVMRNLPGLLPSMRIVHRGKVYNIAGILTDKESGLEYVSLPCSEGVNEG